jgi:hypothetical protein
MNGKFVCRQRYILGSRYGGFITRARVTQIACWFFVRVTGLGEPELPAKLPVRRLRWKSRYESNLLVATRKFST